MNKLIETLKNRFEKNSHRHTDVLWQDIEHKITNNQATLKTLQNMEDTGGEPDVIVFENTLYYVDFSKETPKDRRSYCYDEKAWHDRKKFKPESSVEKEAKKIGITLVSESMYMYMQSLEDFDLKTSSWIDTPKSFRDLGGALNAEKRYDRAFIYHNGADSYYASRGFRGFIKI